MSGRVEQREQTILTIKRHARAQMAREGTAALSLRAIAREMDVTAPALYRYYASRDDLITALIVDAFNGLADAVSAADAAVQPRTGYGRRLLAIMQAYRQWALAHPTDYQLIYGNPIPGYHAPREVTVPATTRTFVSIITALSEAYADGVLRPRPYFLHLPPTVEAHLREFAARDGYPIPPEVFAVTAHGWAIMHGLITLEMHGHTPPVLGDTTAFYTHQITALCREMNLIP